VCDRPRRPVCARDTVAGNDRDADPVVSPGLTATGAGSIV
jgi:hypothetical protein